MAQEHDLGRHDSPSPALKSSSKTGLYHCKYGQETVHDIVAKAIELFNLLKSTQAGLQRTPENDAKRAKIRDTLSAIREKFRILRGHYIKVNDICASLSYVPVKSLIPFKDDPDSVEQILKHRRNLSTESSTEYVREKEELTKAIMERDEQLRKITSDLRNFMYEINTMLTVSQT